MEQEPLHQPIDNRDQIPLPNASAVLVLGILSMPACCCLGGLGGLILGIVAVVMAGKAQDLFRSSPETYTRASYKNVEAGKVMGIIGISLSALIAVTTILELMFGFASFVSMPGMQEFIEEFLR